MQSDCRSVAVAQAAGRGIACSPVLLMILAFQNGGCRFLKNPRNFVGWIIILVSKPLIGDSSNYVFRFWSASCHGPWHASDGLQSGKGHEKELQWIGAVYGAFRNSTGHLDDAMSHQRNAFRSFAIIRTWVSEIVWVFKSVSNLQDFC